MATSKPVWSTLLPDSEYAYNAELAGDILVVATNASVIGLDAGTGRMLWIRRGLHGNVVGTNASLRNGFATDDRMGVARLALATGAILWNRNGVCPSSAWQAGVTTVSSDAQSLYVGCAGGRIVRLDRSTGTTQASTDVFSANVVSDIRVLGNSLSVSGWTSGAITSDSLMLLRADDLHPRWTAQTDTWLLGTIGGSAILDDGCCMGRPDVYQPATIVRVDLATGTDSVVDLAPDPDHFPADRRPIGQGSSAALVGSRLFLTVDERMYDAGEALAASPQPRRILPLTTLPPTFLQEGYAYAVYPAADGSMRDTIFDLRAQAPKIVWQSRSVSADRPGVAAGARAASPGVAIVSEYGMPTAVVRLRDGTSIDVPDAGNGPFASDDRAFYAAVRPRPLAEQRQRIVKYAFPMGPSR